MTQAEADNAKRMDLMLRASSPTEHPEHKGPGPSHTRPHNGRSRSPWPFITQGRHVLLKGPKDAKEHMGPHDHAMTKVDAAVRGREMHQDRSTSQDFYGVFRPSRDVDYESTENDTTAIDTNYVSDDLVEQFQQLQDHTGIDKNLKTAILQSRHRNLNSDAMPKEDFLEPSFV